MKKGNTLSNQVYEYVKKQIHDGAYGSEKLPTEGQLAQQFFVSRITVKNAMLRLAEEGEIVRIQGRGTYVRNGDAPGVCIAPKADAASKRTIALVMGGFITASFGLDILNGAVDTAQRRGAHLIVGCTHNDQQEETAVITSLMDSGVDGAIVQPVHGEMYSKQLVQAVYSGYPIVMLDRRMRGIDTPFVGVNNQELSRMAVRKLLDNGHVNIALFALPDERSSTIRERMDGFMEACVDWHVPVNKELWLTGMNQAFDQPPELLNSRDTYEDYVRQIVEHLRRHPEITAIFGTEYRVSKAAWDAIRTLGKSVPRDFSLVSFDMDSSYIGSHTMSYIKQPQFEMGVHAIDTLLDAIEGKPRTAEQLILDGEWVDGGTVRRNER